MRHNSVIKVNRYHMTTDELIEVIDGSIRENVVNIPSIDIYNVRYDPNIKIFLRNLFEWGKYNGYEEYKRNVINLFNF